MEVNDRALVCGTPLHDHQLCLIFNNRISFLSNKPCLNTSILTYSTVPLAHYDDGGGEWISLTTTGRSAENDPISCIHPPLGAASAARVYRVLAAVVSSLWERTG